MSPGTRYLASTCCIFPSRKTWQVGGSKAPILSKVFSDRYSWTNPTVTTMMMAIVIEAGKIKHIEVKTWWSSQVNHTKGPRFDYLCIIFFMRTCYPNFDR